MTTPEIFQTLTILLASGIVAGILAGLLGVGGGIVLVPALVLVLAHIGYQGDYAMQIAVATSLCTIIVTSSRSVQAHFRRGAVDMVLLRRLAIPVPVGALLGMWLAQRVDSLQLMALFGALGTCVGLYMAVAPGVARDGVTLPRTPVLSGVSALFGCLSALIGIGGGSFFVPFLSYFGRSSHQAVATSSGVGVLIAVPAAIGFLLSPSPALAPLGTVGFVSLPAAAIIICATILFAPVGAALAHRMNAKLLKRVFGGFLVLTAGKMLLAALGIG